MSKISYKSKVKEIMKYEKSKYPKRYLLTKSELLLIDFSPKDSQDFGCFELLDLYYIASNGKPFFIVIDITEEFEVAIKWLKEK